MHKIILVGFVFFSLQSISQTPVVPFTQATLNVEGGTAAITPSFILDWSVGESTSIETYYGENTFSNLIIGTYWNVTSGILQPFDNKHIIFNPFVRSWTNQEIRIYPVPTPKIIFIDFRSVTSGKITIQLLNNDLRLLGIKEFTQINGNSTQTWNLSNQPSGVYYFRILLSGETGELLKQGTFKFEKIQ